MRGVSPIVATILIILLVVAIGIILYSSLTNYVSVSTSTLGRTSMITFTIDASTYAIEAPGAMAYYMHYYIPIDNPMTWEEAFNYCKERGFHLLTPDESGDVKAALSDKMKELGWTYAWIGLYQEAGAAEPDDGWNFVTGSPITLSFWKSGEPNGGTAQNVAAVDENGEWVDLNYDMNLPFFCETSALQFTFNNKHSANLNLELFIVRSERFSMNLRDAHRFSVNLGGVEKTFEQPYVWCNRYVIPAGGSATCRIIDTNPNFRTSPSTICLSGYGATICDSVYR